MPDRRSPERAAHRELRANSGLKCVRKPACWTPRRLCSSVRPANRTPRRGGRAVECTGLENRRPLTGTVGSNPTLSARIQQNACGIRTGSTTRRSRVGHRSVSDCGPESSRGERRSPGASNPTLSANSRLHPVDVWYARLGAMRAILRAAFAAALSGIVVGVLLGNRFGNSRRASR